MTATAIWFGCVMVSAAIIVAAFIIADALAEQT